MIFIKKYDIIFIESKGKDLVRFMNIERFYVAYAYRAWADHNHIEKEVETFEEAERIAFEMLFDDDDSTVLINVDGQWYTVWGRDPHSQALVVSKEYDDARNAYVSNWY